MIRSIFSPRDFERIDEEQDEAFYATPRLVVHVDQPAVQTISQALAYLLPPNAEILDLMSSWRSHLPPNLAPRRVVGLGMNGTEMGENDQLTEYVIHDLNEQPRLSFPDQSFDAAMNIVSVQYLTQPVEVFRDVRRVLRPGGPYVVIFSNRMFPTKAVRIWRESSEQGRVDLVRSYFEQAGGWADIQTIEGNRADSRGNGVPERLNWLDLAGDPVWVVAARRAG